MWSIRRRKKKRAWSGPESVEPHCISPDNKTLSCWLIPTAQGAMRSRSSSPSPPNIYIDMLACWSNVGPPCANINRLLQPRHFILHPCSFLSISHLLPTANSLTLSWSKTSYPCIYNRPLSIANVFEVSQICCILFLDESVILSIQL